VYFNLYVFREKGRRKLLNWMVASM